MIEERPPMESNNNDCIENNDHTDGIVEKAGSRLYQKGKETQEKLASKRQETPEGCTFQPTVNRTAYSSKVSTPNGKDRFNRLYEGLKSKDI